MIPLFAQVATHPHLAVNLAVVALAEVHLRAVVALLVRLVAVEAVLAEAHMHVLVVQLYLRELRLFLRQRRVLRLIYQLNDRAILFATGVKFSLLGLKPLLLGRVVGAAEAVVARFFGFTELFVESLGCRQERQL